MQSTLHRTFTLIPLGTAACALALLTGCGGTGSPVAPQAAKTMYVVNYGHDPNNNDIALDTVLGYSTAVPASSTPTTTLNLASGFSVDNIATGPDGKLYVSGETASDDTKDDILVFAPGATGSATPLATINGSVTANSGTFTYAYYMAVNSKGQLFVDSQDNALEVFAAGATGAATPTQYITWGTQNNNFSDVYGIAADGNGEAFVVDYENNEIYVFAAGATGNTAPVRTVTGTNVDTFHEIWTIAADDAGNVYTTNWNEADEPSASGTPESNRPFRPIHQRGKRALSRPRDVNPSGTLPTGIIEFAAGATGKATPLRTISGSTSGVIYPSAVAVDAVSNVYYLDDYLANGPLMMFNSAATGDAAPSLSITLSTQTNIGFGQLALY